MNDSIYRLKVQSLLVVGFLFASAPALAQDASQVGKKIAQNSQALRQYSWIMRAEYRSRDQQAVGIYKMRYDLDGRLQRTAVTGEAQQQEVPEEILALGKAALAYAQPRPRIAEAFMSRAQVWEGQGSGKGTVRIEGTGMLVTDDSVTIRMVNEQVERMEVQSLLNEQPVTIRTDYRKLPNGPVHVARLVVSQPSEGLELKIENFDYLSNTAAPAPPPPPKNATIAKGTALKVRLAQPLSSKQNKSGQSFEAILDHELSVAGRLVLARGSRIVGRLDEVKKSGRVKGRAKMTLRLTAVYSGSRQIPIQTNAVTLEAEGSKRRDARRIGGGAGLGALVGAIADGGEGAAKGAAIGAGVGTAATLMTKGKEVQLTAEQLMSFTLQSQVEITTE